MFDDDDDADDASFRRHAPVDIMERVLGGGTSTLRRSTRHRASPSEAVGDNEPLSLVPQVPNLIIQHGGGLPVSDNLALKKLRKLSKLREEASPWSVRSSSAQSGSGAVEQTRAAATRLLGAVDTDQAQHLQRTLSYANDNELGALETFLEQQLHSEILQTDSPSTASSHRSSRSQEANVAATVRTPAVLEGVLARR
jgi:hypothetical protein